jgi:hypothetical protein
MQTCSRAISGIPLSGTPERLCGALASSPVFVPHNCLLSTKYRRTCETFSYFVSSLYFTSSTGTGFEFFECRMSKRSRKRSVLDASETSVPRKGTEKGIIRTYGSWIVRVLARGSYQPHLAEPAHAAVDRESLTVQEVQLPASGSAPEYNRGMMNKMVRRGTNRSGLRPKRRKPILSACQIRRGA